MQSKNGRKKNGKKKFPDGGQSRNRQRRQEAPEVSSLAGRSLPTADHPRLLIGRCKSWHPQWWLRCRITSKRDHGPDLTRVSLLVIEDRIPPVMSFILCQRQIEAQSSVVSNKPCMHFVCILQLQHHDEQRLWANLQTQPWRPKPLAHSDGPATRHCSGHSPDLKLHSTLGLLRCFEMGSLRVTEGHWRALAEMNGDECTAELGFHNENLQAKDGAGR